jgi:hypothetical protein
MQVCIEVDAELNEQGVRISAVAPCGKEAHDVQTFHAMAITAVATTLRPDGSISSEDRDRLAEMVGKLRLAALAAERMLQKAPVAGSGSVVTLVSG